MILLPFMTTWMWFQIFAASPLPSLDRPVEDICDADVSVSSINS
jgi:hypothetical protein